jgi:mevalonate kinase
MVGSAVGTGVAIILLTLTFLRPSLAVEKVTFRLCPLFILGFGMGSWASVIVVTIVGNAVFYGAAFGALSAVVSLYKRLVA